MNNCLITYFHLKNIKTESKNRWFFTYMGHPDEVDAGKDDKDVVGLLKSMSKEGTDIYAEIDLLDTPLGRIVKTLIDAGVNFWCFYPRCRRCSRRWYCRP